MLTGSDRLIYEISVMGLQFFLNPDFLFRNSHYAVIHFIFGGIWYEKIIGHMGITNNNRRSGSNGKGSCEANVIENGLGNLIIRICLDEKSNMNGSHL